MQAVKTIITFIGIVSLLLGIYFSFRTFEKLQLKEYPLYVQSQGSEFDCMNPTVYYSYNDKGQISGTREPFAGEKNRDKISQENCIKKIQLLRQNAKTSDINEVVLWLLLGIGILGSRKFLFK